ncbi:MAG: exodeoxyribonuclease I [Gammaproteobacteria bacterium]|nr:exodeoxyribonuclease I [Gammaproteobacteria bacterium]MBQ0840821.1 exodeoxyribonuclease I [Gammaproteobacteria bacterium]
MKPTLYWHDYETTGVDPARDRPIQFAGLRTDEELNVIGEPLVQYCQLADDCLPQPQACLITGITPQKARDEGVREPQFIAAIHRELSQPGTCGVGYNSLRFDDEITRFTLYRNFYDPYEREWQQGNSRWDIIDMLRLTRALRPEGIVWPNKPDGAPSFRLEELTAANNIEHAAAHDALSDVTATIAMARLVKEKQPRLYDYVYGHRFKHKAASLVDMVSRKPFFHVSSRLPRDNGYAAMMMPLAAHPSNKNAVIAVNLMADPEPLLSLDAEQIRQRLFTATADLPEGVERMALKGIHLNRCPVIATPKLLDKPAAQRLGIDLERCYQHWQTLCSVDLGDKIAAVFAAPDYPEIEDPEQALYQGFLPNGDKALLANIRSTPLQNLGDESLLFRDERYNGLLFNYRARYAGETLSSAERTAWQQLKQGRLIDGEGGYLTMSAYFAELDTLEKTPQLEPQKAAVLKALRAWGKHLIVELAKT